MLRNLSISSYLLELRLLLIFIAITSILGVIGWYSFESNREHLASESRMIALNEQLRALNRFMLAMEDTETGQRGYLLTGKVSYLEPYEDGLRRVDDVLAEVDQLLRDEPESAAILSAMRALKSEKLAELAQTIELANAGRRDAALQLVATDHGKQSMDKLRALVGGELTVKRAGVLALKEESALRAAASQRNTLLFIVSIIVFMLGAYAVLFHDLTERRRLRKKIDEAGSVDPLTGLPNWRYLATLLANTLKQARRDKTRSALLMVDLDNFHWVNSRYGYETGDRLLKEAAARLKKLSRKNDVVARVSGDTFSMVVPQVPDTSELRILADRIIHALTPPLVPNLKNRYFGASIGIALFPDDAADGQRLLSHAEAAVKKAKAEGKRRYRFYDDQISLSIGRVEQITHDLHRAVEKSEFILHYQPQVDLYSGKIIGVEALLRWEHPELGIIPPDEFVPIAEKTGLILPIGAWTLQKACEQVGQWNERGMRWRAAVNVSSLELMEEDYITLVRDALRTSGLPPEMLELEITERMLLEKRAVAALEDIKALGVHITLDDFGTGYSSLSYLAQFPVNFIKIDKSFISGIPANKVSCALAKSMLGMGAELGIRVVAEGVETEEQAAFLRRVKCGIGQGHLFYQAVSAQEMEVIIARTSVR